MVETRNTETKYILVERATPKRARTKGCSAAIDSFTTATLGFTPFQPNLLNIEPTNDILLMLAHRKISNARGWLRIRRGGCIRDSHTCD